MRNTKKVSVCCAWYNRADYLEDTINSLLTQNYNDFEVVIVNDGSTDPRVKKILNSFHDNRLIIVHQENHGFVHAIKTAISTSNGNYIATQGSGDISYPDRLSLQSEILDKSPKIGIVGCKIINAVKGGKNDGFKIPRKYTTLHPNAKDFLSDENPFSHGEVMFRKNVYDSVGGYRDIFKFAQDRDLWLRMIEICQAEIVNETLYERGLFIADGVSTNLNKIVLQKALSLFARQCYHHRQKFGHDLVDKFQNQAALYRIKSADHANFLCKMSFKSLSIENDALAEEFLRMALNEKITPLVVATLTTFYLFKNFSFFKLILKAILNKKYTTERWTA